MGLEFDVTKLVAIIRHLVSFYNVGKATAEDIKNMTDEEIIAYADEALDRADAKNKAFLDRLDSDEEKE